MSRGLVVRGGPLHAKSNFLLKKSRPAGAVKGKNSSWGDDFVLGERLRVDLPVLALTFTELLIIHASTHPGSTDRPPRSSLTGSRGSLRGPRRKITRS